MLIKDIQTGRHEREFELFDPKDAERVVATIKVRNPVLSNSAGMSWSGCAFFSAHQQIT